MIGKIICFVTRKHKRGKLVDRVQAGPNVYVHTYKCPRCSKTHTRKQRVGA